MVKLIRKMMLAGLGAEAKIRENWRTTLDDLVHRGESNQGDLAKRVKDGFACLEKDLKAVEAKEREFVDRLMAKLPVATKADLKRLEEKIQEMAMKAKRG